MKTKKELRFDKDDYSSDRLSDLFIQQFKLQDRLGNIKKIKSSPEMKQKYINQMILAIHEEAVEIMRETAYKNPDYVEFGWKKGQKFDNEKFKEEIVDIWHFVLNLCIVADMDSDELVARFFNKNQENHKRQDDGY